MNKVTRNTILAACILSVSALSVAAPGGPATPGASMNKPFKTKGPSLTVALKAHVKGKLTMTGCNLKPRFKINNKLVLGKNLILTKKSYGYFYTLTLPGSVKVAKIKPYVDLNKCIGKWSPFDKLIVVKKPGETQYGKDFRFVPGAHTKKIPVALLAAQLQASFKGTKIHLNNYGPRHGNSWYKGNSSFVKLSPLLGGHTRKFSLPAINKFPYRYYVNDVNLQSISVDQVNRKFRIRLKFEGHGTEIKGRCKSNNVIKQIACAAGSDSSAPDVQMNGAVASVHLAPKVSGDKSSITYGDIFVNFKASIQAQGVCKIGGDLCNAITNYKSEIRKGIKKAMFNNLNRNDVRKAVANALRKLIKSQGIKNITSVHINGSYLVIHYKPY